MTPTLTALPDVPLDVLDFAEERDLVGNLRPILTITNSHFPDAPISICLEDDPEIADDRHIVVAVNVTGWTVERMLAARNAWTQDLFKVCPSQDVCAFRIRMGQTE